MKYHVWMGAFFALALVVVWRLMARVERAEAEIGTLRHVTEKPSSQPAQRADVPGGASFELLRAAAGPPRPVDPPSDPRPAQSAAPPAARAAATADMRAYYQSSFEAESIDVNWARDAARSLRGVFDQMASPATALKSVDCRQTMCRAELTHDSDGDSRAFFKNWMYGDARRQWKGPVSGGIVGSENGGPVRTVFFFAREGTDLPEFN